MDVLYTFRIVLYNNDGTSVHFHQDHPSPLHKDASQVAHRQSPFCQSSFCWVTDECSLPPLDRVEDYSSELQSSWSGTLQNSRGQVKLEDTDATCGDTMAKVMLVMLVQIRGTKPLEAELNDSRVSLQLEGAPWRHQ